MLVFLQTKAKRERGRGGGNNENEKKKVRIKRTPHTQNSKQKKGSFYDDEN
jgi:hypothetical protein